MKSFKQFILTESKNLHMEHLEDSIFNEGSKGVLDAIRFMESLIIMLEGNSKSGVNVTVKWDGSPAVFAGVHPETKKFFVGSKSIFNKNPKVNYTNTDIDKNHGGSPGLAQKLKIALKHLKGLNIKGILQGDVLFTDDKKIETIDDEKYITFRPNTITYAVHTDSDIAKKIKKAKIGVVWHTKYSGSEMSKMRASFNPNISSLSKSNSVWFQDASFKDVHGHATFKKGEAEDIEKLLSKIKTSFGKSKAFIDELASKEKIIYELKIYQNKNVRQGISNMTVKEFIKSVDDKLKLETSKLKSEKGKEKKESKRKEIISFLSRNSKKLDSVFSLHSDMTVAKMKIIRKLQKVKSIGTFIRTENGYRVTEPEGFVAIDKTSKALKLVDRLEFSRQNFTAAKNWVKG